MLKTKPIVLMGLVASCTTPIILDCVEIKKESLDYIKEICLSTEFGTNGQIRTWKEDTVRVSCNCEGMLSEEFDTIVSELSSLIGLQILRVESNADIIGHCGSIEDYIEIEPRARHYQNQLGLFFTNSIEGEIIKGSFFVDTVRLRARDTQMHLLREEFTQCFGFFNDSYSYSESMFYQGWTRTRQYSQLDKEIIQVVYKNKESISGMREEALEQYFCVINNQ